MPTLEEALKPLFQKWLEEAMPQIEEHLRQEIMLDLGAKVQQTLFTQQEMAQRLSVSVETFRIWRKRGLPSEPNPTGKLLFDVNKVNRWLEKSGR